MWNLRDIDVSIEEVEGALMVVSITTPSGRIDVIGDVSRVGRVLHVRDAHVQGLTPGALGRRGLNAIGRKLMEEADVQEIVIEGSARTTGGRPGQRPRAIRFPRQARAPRQG